MSTPAPVPAEATSAAAAPAGAGVAGPDAYTGPGLPEPVAGPIPLPADLPTVPPALLHARPITDAHEVLVLSYTSDLHFFESTCLGDALASTGRVTVVRDADKGVPAAETRLAGSRYLDVPVRCRSGGAFHPKLVVIASPDRAVAAIGSGNVTASGWHYNAELWTVITGEGATWPAAFAELAAWLKALPDFLLIDAFGAERLRDVGAMLAGRQYSGGPALAHNLRRPILGQLPEGPVRRLGVASPFLDSRAAALAAVRARLQPRTLALALTRGASFDAAALADVLDAPPEGDPGATAVDAASTTAPVTASTAGAPTATAAAATAAPIDSGKYHHGKLLQWKLDDGSRAALVGSANCTYAAMLATTSDLHGNCELGLIVEDLAQRDLMPVTGEPLDRAGLTDLAAEGPALPSDRAAATPFLARALLVPAGLRLTVLGVGELALSASHVLWNGEAYALQPAEDSGSGFAHVAAAAGDLVRVRFPDGTETAAVPVTDPDRVLARLHKPSPLEQHTLASILSDPSLTQELLDALEHLATVRPRPPSGGSTSERTPAQWLEQWELAASATLGPSIVALALGSEPAGAGALHRAGALDGDVFEVAGELGDVDVEDDLLLDDMLDDELTAAEQEETERDRRRAERHRRRIVSLLSAQAETADDWDLPAQLSLLRVLMVAVGSGLFADHDWTPAVASLARAVARPAAHAAEPPGDVSEDAQPDGEHAAPAAATPDGLAAELALRPRRIAIATVCLAMVARDSDTDAAGSQDLAEFRTLRAALPDSADNVDHDLVRAYAAGLDRLLGVTMSAEAIIDALDHLLAEPLRRLAASLCTDSVTVQAAGPRLLEVEGKGQARGLAYSVLARSYDPSES